MTYAAPVSTALSLLNRRNAYRILPILLLGNVWNALDKTNVGFAALQMNAELGFSPQVFGFGAGIFFITYTLSEIPANAALRRIGGRRWLAGIMVVWGCASMATCFVYDRPSFYLARLVLGMAESGWLPGVLYFTALWFPKTFRARATTLFYLGTPLGAIIGGPLSGWLLGMHPGAGMSAWQLLFIVEGVPSAYWPGPSCVTARQTRNGSPPMNGRRSRWSCRARRPAAAKPRTSCWTRPRRYVQSSSARSTSCSPPG